MAADEPCTPPWLGCRGPGRVQRDEFRPSLVRGPYGGGCAVRCVQPCLRDLLIRPERVARSHFRSSAGQIQRCGSPDMAARRRKLHGDRDSRRRGHGRMRACGNNCARRCSQVCFPGARTDAASTPAARQLAVFILRTRAWQTGIPQRPGLGGGAHPGIVFPAGDKGPKRILVRSCVGRWGSGGRRCGAVASTSRAEAI